MATLTSIDPHAALAALALVGLCGVLAYVIIRSQLVGCGILLLVFVVTDATRDQQSLSVAAGGFQVFATDVVCALFLGVAAFRSVTRGPGGRLAAAGWGLALLLVLHITRGTLDFGPQVAVNSARPWLYFLAPLLFAVTAPNPWDLRFWRLIAGTGVVLAVVSVPYLLADGLHPASKLILQNGELVSDRPITSAGALVILESAILLTTVAALRFRAAGVIIFFVFADIIAIQQRTVWVATAAVCSFGFWAWSRRQLPEKEPLVLASTGVLLLASPFVLMGFLANSSFRQSVSETTESTGTFAWRTQGWNQLLGAHHSLADIATGGPAGASWARLVNGEVVTVAPHNAFVEAFLRFGAPGVVLLAGLLVVLWIQRARVSAGTRLPSYAVGFIVVAQGVYCVTYSLDLVQGLIVGVLIAGLTVGSRRGEDRDRGQPTAGRFAVVEFATEGR